MARMDGKATRRMIERAYEALKESGLGKTSDEVGDEIMVQDIGADGEAVAQFIGEEITPQTLALAQKLANDEGEPPDARVLLGMEWMDGFVTGIFYERLRAESEKAK